MKRSTQVSSVLTAAARPLVLADGTTYQMSPLRDVDLCELDHWVQSKFLETARIGLRTDSEMDRHYPALVRQAMSMTALEDGADLLVTREGMLYFTWVCCRRMHPDLTVDDIASHMCGPDGQLLRDNVRAVNDNFGMLHPPSKRARPARAAADHKQAKA